MRIALLLLVVLPGFGLARNDSSFIATHYHKIERMIPMRDGVKLFTAIYIPNDTSERYPFLMERTPYSCYPYGANNMRKGRLGPDTLLTHEKYIFVYQDVRGRYKSEGQFDEMTPSIVVVADKKTDESTDTYDTIDWLLANISNNNGRVGIYGISYPGFYATTSLPGAHPAIKAVSPQAPVTDEFIGDDVNHNGAYFLMDNFDFTNYFSGTPVDSGRNYKSLFEITRSDAYSFFLKLGAVKNTNGPAYFNHRSKIWNEYLAHSTYDAYWQQRNIRNALKDIRPAVLLVGGWYDAEDLFGSLRTFEAIKKQNPDNHPRIVMGPWTHGAWYENEWLQFAGINFGSNVNSLYQQEIEAPFFNYYLKDKGNFSQPEAMIFETGSNQWKNYSSWPPATSRPVSYFLQPKGQLSNEAPLPNGGFDQYISDPAQPVPYTGMIQEGRTNEYMAEDQFFLSGRKDVLAFQSAILSNDQTIAGRPMAQIYLSCSGTDADIIIKLIDVDADSARVSHPSQRLIRAEVFRAKFRGNYEKPSPLTPGEITLIPFSLNEIDHVFKKGHRIMVQVQSSWFPLVDRNPQQFLNIPECSDADFKKATIKIYHDANHPSALILPVLGG